MVRGGAPATDAGLQAADRDTGLAAALLRRRLTLVPAAAALGALLVTGLISLTFQRAVTSQETARFELLAADAVSRATDRMSAHLTLLDGFAALHNVSPDGFDSAALSAYVRELDLERRYAGVRGIGFAKRIRAERQAEAAAAIGADYDLEVSIHPALAGEGYPVTLLETVGARPNAMLGYDLASEPARLAALERARDTGNPSVTAVVDVVPWDDRRDIDGFLVFRPVYTRGPPPADQESRRRRIVGMVYSSFRAAEFFSAVLDPSVLRFVTVEVFDGPPEDGRLVYASEAVPPAPRHVALQPVQVAGRTWVFRMASRPAFDSGGSTRLVLPVAALGLLLSLAAGVMVRQRMLAHVSAEEERQAELRAARDKDFLLQEMKHRIKNALARVQAVARQTARTTDTVEDFLAAFEARLSAMSATHDLLTRSRWEGADLREVLVAEIEPVLGPVGREIRLEGPAARLDARQVLALGLTLHELATNAVKYGGVLKPGGGLSVRWRVDTATRPARVVLDWAERGEPEPSRPDRRGFGTRLIETSVTRELDGTFERRFEPDGHVCRLTFPLQA